jgi:hypothetical protein
MNPRTRRICLPSLPLGSGDSELSHGRKSTGRRGSTSARRRDGSLRTATSRRRRPGENIARTAPTPPCSRRTRQPRSAVVVDDLDVVAVRVEHPTRPARRPRDSARRRARRARCGRSARTRRGRTRRSPRGRTSFRSYRCTAGVSGALLSMRSSDAALIQVARGSTAGCGRIAFGVKDNSVGTEGVSGIESGERRSHTG